MIVTIIGKNIKYLRHLNNMSQDELSEMLGKKSYTTVAKWESGASDPPLKTIRKLSEIFNIDINELTAVDLQEVDKTPAAINIGDIIKQFREKRGLTVRDVAKETGISIGYISMLENNRNPKTGKPLDPSISTIQSLAKFMNMSTSDLITLSESGFCETSSAYDKTTIGNRIRMRRKDLNMTQTDLAVLLGYTSKSTIAKIESGTNDVTAAQLMPFAEALQTSPAYIMGWPECTSHENPINCITKEIKIESGNIIAIKVKVDSSEDNTVNISVSAE